MFPTCQGPTMNLRAILTGLLSMVLSGQVEAGANPPEAPTLLPVVLVAAVGERFTAIEEMQSTGTHLPPYRKRILEAPGHALNLLVLQSLDDVIGRLSPGRPRILLSASIPAEVASDAPGAERAALASVVTALSSQPGRERWGKLLVVTPAFRSLDRDGLASGLRGLGLYFQPMCESNPWSCEHGHRPPSGPIAETASGDTRPVSHFVAPYSYLAFWVLDPATFAVLDHFETFDHRKLAASSSSALLNPQDIEDRQFIARSVQQVIHRTVQAGVAQSAFAGTVDIGDLREVKPAAKPAR